MGKFNYGVPRAEYGADGRKKRPCRRRISLRAKNRRIVTETSVAGVEHSYHATKGWRKRREYDIANNQAGAMLLAFIRSERS